MTKKKQELILIAAALFICAALFLIAVFRQPQYSPLMPAEDRILYTTASVVTENRTGMVDINTDDIELLKTLEGISDVKAQAILDYREENGDFASIYELRMVEGIGDTILQDNFERIYVQ